MAVKAIQLIQIGTAMGSEEKARETIRLMKEAELLLLPCYLVSSLIPYMPNSS